MPSDIIKFRETKEFKQTITEARELLQTENQSDMIRILCNLGLKRLKEAFNEIENVTHTLKSSETSSMASSIKIFLLAKKQEQLKKLKE